MEKKETKHNHIYCCKRLRLLEYLHSKGFKPFATVFEDKNGKYSNWLFINTPELEDVIYEYFSARWKKD